MVTTKVNKTTKKAQGMIWAYEHSTKHSLDEAYKSYSYEKQAAERECRRRMLEVGGRDFRITGANCHNFSCAYRTDTHLYYETVGNTYEIEL